MPDLGENQLGPLHFQILSAKTCHHHHLVAKNNEKEIWKIKKIGINCRDIKTINHNYVR